MPESSREMTFAVRAKAFRPEAFKFVRDGLAHTTRMIHGERPSADSDSASRARIEEEASLTPNRHINGQQLCLGLKDFALRQYGMLAGIVLNRWGLRQTEDFGTIVFALIEAGVLRKSSDDSIEDFRAVYDFKEAFTLGDQN